MASPPSAPPRLIIVKMVLHNFKSYAGTKEIGPFHKNFSSVVGPNGSGKSNVIDSLLFVLGRRANQIRLKKLSELIHKSTDFPNLQECRVDVHFAEILDCDVSPAAPEGFTLVPNSEFTVSRTANSESHSTYKINSRNCSGNDVQALLKGKGMDLDNNRFLILQGEVELISLMKPKGQTPGEQGILEYLEDLIGTNQYVQPIEELSAKVDALNEERQEKLQRLKIVEKEKDSLEGPKLEAEEWQAKAHELNLQKIQLAQIQRADAAEQNREFEEAKEKLDREKQQLVERTQECTASLKTLEADFTTKQDSHDQITAQIHKSKLDFGSFERKLTKSQEQAKHLRTKADKHQAKWKTAQKKAQEVQEKMEADAVALPKALKRLEKIVVEKAAWEEKVASKEKDLIAVSEPFKIEIEAMQKAMMPLQAETNAAQQAVDVSTAEIAIYKEKVAGSEKKYNDVKAMLVKANQEMGRLTADTQSHAGQYAAAVKKASELDEELLAVQDQEVKGLKRRTELVGKIEDSKASASSAQGTSKVLSALMAAKKKKLLPGIFGRLGDLGAIDAKYDVAMTTGVGALDMVLVDSSATGAKAIQYLKQNNIGRGRFLALDKQQGFAADKLEKMKDTPEGVPRLFDLIQFADAKFAPAFYFACRDTLVAENLTQATRIAYGVAKRWRVVTLDGKVVETSGAMSGGGAEIRRGGMAAKLGAAAASSSSASSSEEGVEGAVDPKVLEGELVKLEHNLAAIRLAKKGIEAEVRVAQKAVGDLETTMAKAKSTLEGLQASVGEYKSRCAALEKNLSLSAEELQTLKALEGDLARQLAALSTAKKASKVVSDKIAKLQTKIMERGGGDLEQLKKQVTELNVEHAVLQEEVNKMQVLAETGDKKRAKFLLEATEAKEEVDAVQAELVKLQEEEEAMLDKAATVQAKLKEAETCLADASAALDTIQTAFSSAKAQLQTLKSSRVDLDEKEKDQAKASRETNARVVFWEKKIVALRKSINREILNQRKEVDLDAGANQLQQVELEEEEKKEADEADEQKAPAKKGRAGKRAAVAAAAEDADEGGVDSEFEGAYTLLTAEELSRLDRRAIERAITILEESLSQLKPNMAAIVAYLKKEKEYNQRVAILDGITQARDTARKTHEELRKKRLDEFMSGFGLITMKLKEMYQMLTLGGDAELELVDSLDPFSEGIVFSVRPPKKSWKNITNLSGGEKTLSSLALVFALHHYKPTPLYVMDEIDAALDFKNVSIVANYIKERTRNAQFIIISLRNNMFELADRLVGIYKTNNITKSITIDPKLFVQPADGLQHQEDARMEQQQVALAQPITA